MLTKRNTLSALCRVIYQNARRAIREFRADSGPIWDGEIRDGQPTLFPSRPWHEKCNLVIFIHLL